MFDSLTMGMFVPLSFVYLVARSGTSISTVGTLLTIAGIATVPAPLIVGRLVDRHGPQRPVVAAQIIQAAGFVVYLYATTWQLILAAAIVVTLGQRIYWASAFTLIGTISGDDPHHRASEWLLGALSSMRATGYGLGSLVAGVAVASRSSTASELVVVGSVVLMTTSAALMAVGGPRPRSPAPTSRPTGDYRTLIADRPFLAFIGLNTVFALCNVMLGIALAPFVEQSRPVVLWLVGPLLALNTLLQATCQMWVVRLLRRLRRHLALCLAATLWAMWATLFAVATVVPHPYEVFCLGAATLCYSAAQLVHSPSSNALAFDAAPVELRGRYLAVFQYSFVVATAVAPALASWLLTWAPIALWIATGSLAAAAVPASLALARHLPPAAVTGRAPERS